MINEKGYDATSIFSPEGRVFQVEYAREAVKRGLISIGINCIDGVIIGIEKKDQSKLIKISNKIFNIDDHIIMSASGIVPDAREIVDHARYQAQINKATYDVSIKTGVLVKKICDLIHYNTTRGGIRPFATALLIAGIDDDKTSLFETDPSGAFWECNAAVIGANKDKIIKILEEKYTDNITINDAKHLIFQILGDTAEINIIHNS